MSRRQFVLARLRHVAHDIAVTHVKAHMENEIAHCMRDDHRLTAQAVVDALRMIGAEMTAEIEQRKGPGRR